VNGAQRMIQIAQSVDHPRFVPPVSTFASERKNSSRVAWLGESTGKMNANSRTPIGDFQSASAAGHDQVAIHHAF